MKFKIAPDRAIFFRFLKVSSLIQAESRNQDIQKVNFDHYMHLHLHYSILNLVSSLSSQLKNNYFD